MRHFYCIALVLLLLAGCADTKAPDNKATSPDGENTAVANDMAAEEAAAAKAAEEAAAARAAEEAAARAAAEAATQETPPAPPADEN